MAGGRSGGGHGVSPPTMTAPAASRSAPRVSRLAANRCFPLLTKGAAFDASRFLRPGYPDFAHRFRSRFVINSTISPNSSPVIGRLPHPVALRRKARRARDLAQGAQHQGIVSLAIVELGGRRIGHLGDHAQQEDELVVGHAGSFRGGSVAISGCFVFMCRSTLAKCRLQHGHTAELARRLMRRPSFSARSARREFSSAILSSSVTCCARRACSWTARSRSRRSLAFSLPSADQPWLWPFGQW